MDRKFEHGFFGSTALTTAVMRSVDALILGQLQPLVLFAIASADRTRDAEPHALVSFSLQQKMDDENREMLHWRINRTGEHPFGIGSESIYVCRDTMDAFNYLRSGVHVVSELSAHINSIMSQYQNSQVFLVDIKTI